VATIRTAIFGTLIMMYDIVDERGQAGDLFGQRLYLPGSNFPSEYRLMKAAGLDRRSPCFE
jgi:hypothetical protein